MPSLSTLLYCTQGPTFPSLPAYSNSPLTLTPTSQP
jgi:hypothetical protein